MGHSPEFLPCGEGLSAAGSGARTVRGLRNSKKQSLEGHEIVGALLVCHMHRTRADRLARAAEADDVAAPAQVKVPGRYLQRALQHFPEPFHAASSSP